MRAGASKIFSPDTGHDELLLEIVRYVSIGILSIVTVIISVVVYLSLIHI